MRDFLGKLATTWFFGGMGAFISLALVGLWHAALLVGVVWLLVLVAASTTAFITFVWRD